jgi:uncharacterized protein (TIGR04141 family)
VAEHQPPEPSNPENSQTETTGNDGGSSAGILVDLNAVLLKPTVRSPHSAVTDSVNEDETTKWYVLGTAGTLVRTDRPPVDDDVALLVRRPRGKEPAWHELLRDYLEVADFAADTAESSGAILFVRTVADGELQLVAWCFGQGGRWIRRRAASPRFGLLVALNALADSAGPDLSDDIGVIGASIATRAGNLRRANLTAAVPDASDALPRIDTLADVLTAARIRTGHDILGRVSAGRSLQFTDVVGSIDRFRELSALIAKLAVQDGYKASNGWVDNTVPEDDEQIVQAVLEQVWKGVDNNGVAIDVDIAWWEDVREAGSDHPVTHWRLASERRERKNPSRRVTLTWPAVQSALRYMLAPDVPGHEALATDIRFFADDEQELGRCPVADLLSAELILDGTTYVLVDGQVCRVDANFLATLEQELDQHLAPSGLVPYKPGELENPYNERAAKNTGMIVLDKKDIRPRGTTQIEPCDLLGTDGTLCHVKRHTTASGISHLANQAIASATVLLREDESRQKLGDLIEASNWNTDEKRRVKRKVERIPVSSSRIPVALAIVGEWNSPSVKSLSLLSCMALRSAIQKLGDLGYQTRIMLIGPN